MISLHSFLWFTYFATACLEFEHSPISGCYHISIFFLEASIWRSLLSAFPSASYKRHILVRNMAVSTVTWAIGSYIIVSPALFFTKVFLTFQEENKWLSWISHMGGLFAMVRFWGVWFGMWGYTKMSFENNRLFVNDIVTYCLSSGIGVHVAARFLGMDSARHFLIEAKWYELCLRFVRAALRHLFDLLQHVYVALPYAERHVLGRRIWLVRYVFNLLVSCFLFQGVVRMPDLLLEKVAEVFEVHAILDEVLEIVVLFLFVGAFAMVCWRRYTKLVALEDRDHTQENRERTQEDREHPHQR